MVKGITRRVVVIKSPDQNIFDEAVFIVREDALHRGVTNSEILRDAQDAAEGALRAPEGADGAGDEDAAAAL